MARVFHLLDDPVMLADTGHPVWQRAFVPALDPLSFKPFFPFARKSAVVRKGSYRLSGNQQLILSEKVAGGFIMRAEQKIKLSRARGHTLNNIISDIS